MHPGILEGQRVLWDRCLKKAKALELRGSEEQRVGFFKKEEMRKVALTNISNISKHQMV